MSRYECLDNVRAISRSICAISCSICAISCSIDEAGSGVLTAAYHSSVRNYDSKASEGNKKKKRHASRPASYKAGDLLMSLHVKPVSLFRQFLQAFLSANQISARTVLPSDNHPTTAQRRLTLHADDEVPGVGGDGDASSSNDEALLQSFLRSCGLTGVEEVALTAACHYLCWWTRADCGEKSEHIPKSGIEDVIVADLLWFAQKLMHHSERIRFGKLVHIAATLSAVYLCSSMTLSQLNVQGGSSKSSSMQGQQHPAHGPSSTNGGDNTNHNPQSQPSSQKQRLQRRVQDAQAQLFLKCLSSFESTSARTTALSRLCVDTICDFSLFCEVDNFDASKKHMCALQLLFHRVQWKRSMLLHCCDYVLSKKKRTKRRELEWIRNVAGAMS